jgi:hypothetical protein
MKHAFLIIAHNEYDILRLLVSLLDDIHNDIFIMIDKKSDMPKDIEVKHSQIFWLKHRIDIRWGDISGIKAELSLFKCAVRHSSYMYYHLLSGVDLPIKPIDKIQAFYEDEWLSGRKEFVGFVQTEDWQYKVKKYHLFTRYYRMTGLKDRVFSFLRFHGEKWLNAFFQRDNSIEFKKGANWVSITDDFCRFLVKNERFILKRFKYTCCADEIFLQTMLWNSPYRNNIYSLDDEYKGCMREVDWNRGEPHIWGSDTNDYDILRKSDKLFARKFSSKYPEILQKIKILVGKNI